MHAINAFLPLLRAGEDKKIVCVSSSAGDLGSILRAESVMMTAYACSKAALNMMTAKFANTLKPEGFVCVAISPGIVNTSETTCEDYLLKRACTPR
jgi:NAD(P)-dependent dehydrogenase (short-subunit alcohol dehydrogenase family)